MFRVLQLSEHGTTPYDASPHPFGFSNPNFLKVLDSIHYYFIY